MDNLNKEVAQRILSKFWDCTEIAFKDERWDGKHFFVEITSDIFEWKSRVERSQMVYKVLWDLLTTDSIHALKMKLRTPKEV